MSKKYKINYFIPALFLMCLIFFSAIYFYNIKKLNQLEISYQLEKNITDEINKNKVNLKLNNNAKNENKPNKIMLNTPFMLENLSYFFRKHDIIIHAIYFRKIKNTEKIDFLPVKVNLSSTFPDFKEMLLDLSSLPFLTLIHHFSLQKDENNMLAIQLELFIINLSNTPRIKTGIKTGIKK